MPVKVVYDRAEDMAATTSGIPPVCRHRTALTRDGKLLGAEIEIALDGGAYSTLSSTVLCRGRRFTAGGPYYWPNIRVRSKAFATNYPAAWSVSRIWRAAEPVCDRAAHGSHRRGAGDCSGRAAAQESSEARKTTTTGQVIQEDIDLDHADGRARSPKSDYHAETRSAFARENAGAARR